MNLTKILDNEFNGKIISVVWGLGLATLFRHSCVSRNCIIIKSPNHNEIKKNNYKFNNKCYKYEQYAVSCNDK